MYVIYTYTYVKVNKPFVVIVEWNHLTLRRSYPSHSQDQSHQRSFCQKRSHLTSCRTHWKVIAKLAHYRRMVLELRRHIFKYNRVVISRCHPGDRFPATKHNLGEYSLPGHDFEMKLIILFLFVGHTDQKRLYSMVTNLPHTRGTVLHKFQLGMISSYLSIYEYYCCPPPMTTYCGMAIQVL